MNNKEVNTFRYVTVFFVHLDLWFLKTSIEMLSPILFSPTQTDSND